MPSSKYPLEIDSSLNLPEAQDNSTLISGNIANALRDAIIAVETELGIKPSATYGTVRGRIDQIESSLDNIISNPGSGNVSFGGDLTSLVIGNQQVIGIRGFPVDSGSLALGGSYVFDDASYTGGVARFKKREPKALDPRDFGCPWNGVDDDLPGLQAMIASIPSSQSRPVQIQLPEGQGYCSDNWEINRPVEILGHGKSYSASTSVQNGIKFAPLKGLIFHGYFSSPDYPGGRADYSLLHGLNIISTRAIASDSVGNWGRSLYQLSTTEDTWSGLSSNVQIGSCVLKSGSLVGSPPSEYYGDGTTRNTAHLVMFRCTTAGTKGVSEPSAFATSGVADIGSTISATGGTAVWTVESLPKDYQNEYTYSVGERVFLPGDPDHVFECEIGGLSKGWSTTIAAPSNGASLPQATINVVSTTDFPSSGQARVLTSSGFQVITYTSKTASTLEGCSGGSGSMLTGNAVTAPFNFSAFGVGARSPEDMVAPPYEISFYDRSSSISGASIGQSLPQATIEVLNTDDFANSGTIEIYTGSGFTTVSYAGKTSTTFTGCTGGTGTLASGAHVGQGVRWKHVPGAEGITILANWVDIERCQIAGTTGCAIWITGNYQRSLGGPGGSNFWAVRDCVFNSCGAGITLNSNNANGGESRHCQELFLGAGHTNVDNPEYLNSSTDRWGNGSAAVKDRVQGNNIHSDHYIQFSGGMPFRNDLFTSSTPGGNSTLWEKLAAESDFKTELIFPAIAISSPYGVSSNSSATILDGARSRSIRAESDLLSDPTKSLRTVIGPQNNGAASALTIAHSDDSYEIGFNITDDLLYYPSKWWSFGKANGPGFFTEQVFLFPRPSPAGATWPGGTSVGAETPLWINNDRVWIGGSPNQDPRSIGFSTSIPVSGYYVQGSTLINSSAALGQPVGWQCTSTGSPGTWEPLVALGKPAVRTTSISTVVTDVDYHISCLSGGITISLPTSPATGERYEIKDANGNAELSPITIDSGSISIDNAVDYTISINYQSITLVYNGTKWSLV